MIDYIELHEKNKPMIAMLSTEEKAALLEMLMEYGLQEKDIGDIDPDIYRNNRVIAVVYQAILNDSV